MLNLLRVHFCQHPNIRKRNRTLEECPPLLTALLGNQTQMVPGADPSSLCFSPFVSQTLQSVARKPRSEVWAFMRPHWGEQRLRKGTAGGGVASWNSSRDPHSQQLNTECNYHKNLFCVCMYVDKTRWYSFSVWVRTVAHAVYCVCGGRGRGISQSA